MASASLEMGGGRWAPDIHSQEYRESPKVWRCLWKQWAWTHFLCWICCLINVCWVNKWLSSDLDKIATGYGGRRLDWVSPLSWLQRCSQGSLMHREVQGSWARHGILLASLVCQASSFPDKNHDILNTVFKKNFDSFLRNALQKNKERLI